MRPARRRVLVAGLAAALLHGCGQKPPAQRFPALALKSLDGTDATLAGMGGGALLVNYWATWCAPCRHEMPSLERLSRRLPPEVRLVAVSIDDDLNLAREWLRKLGITFPVFADPGMQVSRDALRIDVLPETFLVAAQGGILQRTRGAREWDSEEALAAIVSALARAGEAA